ncbi:MAG TPA: hypothetical protein VGG82_07690 [Casimicrobiaceae bacterium]|jgi:hypothetical protein
MADRAESLLIRIKTEGADIASEQFSQLHKGLDKNIAGAGKAHQTFGKLGATFGHVGGMVQNLAGYVGAGGLALGLKDAITNAQDLQQNQALLGRSIRVNVHRPTAEATKQMNEYADSLSIKGGFTAPENLQAMTQFTRVTGSQQKAMSDLTMATNVARGAHVDFSRAERTILLAEAGRTTGLARLGISLVKVTSAQDALKSGIQKITPEQARHAKLLDQEATKQEALRLIQQKFAGSTKTFATTSAGMMNMFRNTVDLLSEKIGLKLLPYVDKAVTWLGKFVDQMIHGTGEGGRVARMVSTLANELGKLLKWVLANYKAILLFWGVWKAFTISLKLGLVLMQAWNALKTAQNMRNAAAAMSAMTGETGGLSAAWTVLDEEMDANPIGLVIIAIAALAVGIYELWKHCKVFRDIVKDIWSVLKTFAGYLVTGVSVAIGFVIKHWKLFMLAFGLTGIVIDIVVTHWKLFRKIVGDIIDWLVGAVKVAVKVISTVWGTLTGILSAPFSWVWNKVIHPVMNWIVGAVRWMVNEVGKLLGKITGPLGKVVGAIGKVTGGAIHGFGKLTGIHLQTGGYARGDGSYLVGERGPEMVHLPRGAYVTPNGGGGGGGGGDIVLYNVLDGKVLSKSVVRQGLMQQSKM